MKSYVLGFAFNYETQAVLLIKKERPDWQKGLYNGLGGHIEEGETPVEAMVREFEEESGLRVKPSRWQHYATMCGDDFVCYCFKTFDVRIMEAETKTDEVISCVGIANVFNQIPKISNLPFLVELALDTAAPKMAHLDYTSAKPDKDEWFEGEDEMMQPDPDCSTCGGKDGRHMQGCPEDYSPYAELLRNGYD